MRSWWGKSSSKEAKKNSNKESFIDRLHRKFKIPSESKHASRLGGPRRHSSDTVSEKYSWSQAQSRSQSPSKQVSRCQSFVEMPCAQPLPLPGVHPSGICRTDSGISVLAKPRLEKGYKPSLFLPLPKAGCIRNRPDPTDLDGDVVTASFSSECSIGSDDPTDSQQCSPLTSDYENGSRTATGSPSR
ncbi:mitogen-activated protein kinase kinase kinase [Sarracenia purpurea var. burkii]